MSNLSTVDDTAAGLRPVRVACTGHWHWHFNFAGDTAAPAGTPHPPSLSPSLFKLGGLIFAQAAASLSGHHPHWQLT
jgi:hypothetical protein